MARAALFAWHDLDCKIQGENGNLAIPLRLNGVGESEKEVIPDIEAANKVMRDSPNINAHDGAREEV